MLCEINLIKPLVLGSLSFPVNIIQGPLAGVSSAPFRQLVWQYSKPAFSCTEMISCKTILYQPQLHKRFMQKSDLEGPVCFQLSGSDPYELGEAVKKVTDYGADLIDLNCGCPVNKIRSNGAGSRLLMSPSLLYSLIMKMKSNTDKPVSVKIRVDGSSNDSYNKTIVTVLKDSGVDFVIVHGRHWTESYETPCHFDQIKFFVDELSIPVIGNGDIYDTSSLKKMMETGSDGAMISRAGVGQPWLIGKLMAELNHESFVIPNLPQIGALFVSHVSELCILLDNERFAVLQARKLARYYARSLSNRAEFCRAVYMCETVHALEKICDIYFS